MPLGCPRAPLPSLSPTNVLWLIPFTLNLFLRRPQLAPIAMHHYLAFSPPFRLSFSFISTRRAPSSWRCQISHPHLPSHAYTSLPTDHAPLCRFITSLWQTSAQHGYIPDVDAVTRQLHALVDAGFTTFDLASSPTSVEPANYARHYLRLVTPSAARSLNVCTKVHVSPQSIGPVSRASVERLVDNELARTGLERIHLFQFAWSDFRDKRYIDILGELHELKRLGKIRSIGTINFPTAELRHVHCQSLSVASNQVSFSLVDTRPLVEMTNWCNRHGVALLGYSTLGGGFFSERYLGLPQPTKKACATPSLRRFSTMIQLWGGWSLFQELLYSVKSVADKHSVSMSNVAVKWALQKPALTAVVVGARLGMAENADHRLSNIRAFEFALDDEDHKLLDSVTEKGNNLHQILGDSGQEYQPQQ